MKSELLIGLIGDCNANVRAHRAIPLALEIASRAKQCSIGIEWLGTAGLRHALETRLDRFDGLWCVPGSPYADMGGALNAIRFARVNRRPFLGTCGGFQHALIEYARNVLGIAEADHLESNQEAAMPLIAPLRCSLVGASQVIQLKAGSQAAEIYRSDETIQSFHCNYGLNPQFENLFGGGEVRISGKDSRGEVRIVELGSHPFLMATLFQPELKALDGIVDPLIAAFVQACIEAGH